MALIKSVAFLDDRAQNRNPNMTAKSSLMSKKLDKILAQCDCCQLVDVIFESVQNEPSYIVLPQYANSDVLEMQI